mgnify:FL=1
MAGTIMGTFKAQLLTKLQANDTLSDIQVTYGDPGGAARRECVFLGDITNNQHDPASFSTNPRRRLEDFDLEVFCFVNSKPRSSPQDCEARAIVLATAVEDVIINDPQLGNLTGLLWCSVASMSMSCIETGDGPASTVTVNISAHARLT